MPYINNDQLNEPMNCDYTIQDWTFEEIVDAIGDHISLLPDDKKEGAANYAVTRIISQGFKPIEGWRYMWLNRAYGTFLSAAAEFYRRMVIPYEDKCIEKNGDIPEYEDS